ncbi:MAG TPA: hypothetical protein VMV45_01800, partial [Casimicrobiaceae bacterium]|nr:hypothetical protein [Casimicrobiaceae bacterium]
MSEVALDDRVVFHASLDAVELDLAGISFETPGEVDAFYDHADERLAASGKRWYFIVNYTDCSIGQAAWDRYAERGKNTNIQHGLGTLRFGASEQVREQIRRQAGREMFRANMYATRDQAVAALGEMRKRKARGGEATAETFLRIDNVHLRFGGVKALTGVSF